MPVSNEEIDLHIKYEGTRERGGSREHYWTATWTIPAGDDVEEWQEFISHAVTSDRTLEPVPQGGSFDAGMAGRDVVVDAWLDADAAPNDEAARDGIGAELVGLAQGLMFDADSEDMLAYYRSSAGR